MTRPGTKGLIWASWRAARCPGLCPPGPAAVPHPQPGHHRQDRPGAGGAHPRLPAGGHPSDFLTGTRDPDNEPNLTALTAPGYFYSASLYDNTTLSQALWARMEEDTSPALPPGHGPALQEAAL
ncbi:MAG: hypothetical protein ACLS43_07020 [Evtepia gabavorous]